MYRLVIAEKPSVAMSIAKVLGATARKEGHMEGCGSPVATSKRQRRLEAPTEPTGETGWLVSWCVGHLAGLAEPAVYDIKYIDEAYQLLKTAAGGGRSHADEEFLDTSLENFRAFHDVIAERYNAGYIDLYLEGAEKLLYLKLEETYGKNCPEEAIRIFHSEDTPTGLAAKL